MKKGANRYGDSDCGTVGYHAYPVRIGGKEMNILALDVGTTESGYCLMDEKTYQPYSFGKVANEELLKIVQTEDYGKMVYEAFASYGMAIGQSTIKSIEWNGRFIQCAINRDIPVFPVFRKEEKINICGSMKAKDTNIRQALIDRFAFFDFKNGKGTKLNQDFFDGFSKDAWSAFAIGTTYIDRGGEDVY